MKLKFTGTGNSVLAGLNTHFSRNQRDKFSSCACVHVVAASLVSSGVLLSTI